MKKIISSNKIKNINTSTNGELSTGVFYAKITFSLLTILACLIVIISSAFAFFYSSVQANDTILESARYSVNIPNAPDGKYVAQLAFEDKHFFEITATGNATTGYCKVQIGNNTYYTEQIVPGSSLSLTIIAAKGTLIEITPQWGTSSYYATSQNSFRTIAHSVTPSAPYTVEVTAKLSDIALYYGVSEKDILIYNALTKISVGDALKIPGVEPTVTPYAVPYAEYKVEPTATLSDIALYYGVSEQDILAYNDISSISINSILKIPGVEKNKTPYSVEYATLEVVDGATLEGIALHYGIKASDILIYNNITALRVDTVIKIPGVSSDAVPYIAPKPDPLNNSYYQITTKNNLKTENADLLVYHGKKYDKTKDTNIFELECNKDGQYFFEIKNKMNTLSLCFAITQNIKQGYLKVIIDKKEYYSIPITKDSYVRLDILAAIGSTVRIEVYKGIIDPELGVTVFYGDDLKNNVDEKYMKLDHLSLSAKN